MKETLQTILIQALASLGIQAQSVVLEHPADLAHGDYATSAALAYAKAAQKSPRALAEEIVSAISTNMPKEIASIEIAGPGFINFKLSKDFFVQSVKNILENRNIFGNTKKFSNEVWAIEYASPNPNKAMHLGHLRNVLTGVSLCRIVEANGASVIREMVDNNRGIAIAKLMWGYLVSAKKDGARVADILYWSEHQDQWYTAEDLNVPPDRFVDDLYVKGAAEAEKPESEEQIRNLVVKWEARDSLVWLLWEKVLSYAYEGQKRTLSRLGATFDYVWHEHEHYQQGKDFIVTGLKNGIFRQLEDGAVLSNLEPFNLTDTVVVKKDGTALYITQDIALTELKKNKHKADKMIWVIGPEQSLAMSQLFAICEQLGIGKRDDFLHVAYGYMSVKGQGKMSSRKGNVMYIDDVIDEAKNKIENVMRDRISPELISSTAELIAHGAIAFGILKAGRLTDIAFDIEEALRLEGDTGPYLDYSTVRALSLVEKAKNINLVDYSYSPGDDYSVSHLERLLYRFPEIVEIAGSDLSPNTIATYLLELAGAFNTYYASGLIIDMEQKNLSLYKIALTEAFAVTMKRGLYLLGISVPEKM